MRAHKDKILLLGVAVVLLILLGYFYLWPTVYRISSGLKTYETRVAYRNNYKLHTTPLPQTVVDDMCFKLNLKATSEHCRSDMVVYAPDFFEEIKAYFNNLPDQSKTYDAVQDKLGTYLVSCETPDPDGMYVCHYDLKGDGIYPVAFFFDKHNRYYRIIASTGGS
jgi:hypothetical protein